MTWKKGRCSVKSDNLKLIAMLAMTMDHVIKTIPGENIWLSIIGRAAAIIFVYEVVRGVSVTKDINNYAKRMLYIALAAQPFYMLLFETYALNICFTLYLVIKILEFKGQLNKQYMIMLSAVILTFTIGLDNSFLMLVFALLIDMKMDSVEVLVGSIWITALGMIIITGYNIIHAYMLLAALIIFFFKGQSEYIPRNVFYIYYPLHLILLLGVKLVVGN